MILHDFQCSKGHTFERMVLWTSEKVKCKCGKWAKRVFLPKIGRSENAKRFNAVVVFRKRDGTYIFPGRSNETTPKNATRVELRNVHEVRKFEEGENRRLREAYQARAEIRDYRYHAEKKERRAELSVMLKKMSPRMRQFAQFAMAQSDARESESSKASRFDPNFRVDVFSSDRSNREAWVDQDTFWKSRRE